MGLVAPINRFLLHGHWWKHQLTLNLFCKVILLESWYIWHYFNSHGWNNWIPQFPNIQNMRQHITLHGYWSIPPEIPMLLSWTKHQNKAPNSTNHEAQHLCNISIHFHTSIHKQSSSSDQDSTRFPLPRALNEPQELEDKDFECTFEEFVEIYARTTRSSDATFMSANLRECKQGM